MAEKLLIYLKTLDEAPEIVLAHIVAAAVLYFQMGSGKLRNSLQRLINTIADRMPNPPLPESFYELASIVEQIEGVCFRGLLDSLPQRVKSGDEALTAVLDRVAELSQADEPQSTDM